MRRISSSHSPGVLFSSSALSASFGGQIMAWYSQLQFCVTSFIYSLRRETGQWYRGMDLSLVFFHSCLEDCRPSSEFLFSFYILPVINFLCCWVTEMSMFQEMAIQDLDTVHDSPRSGLSEGRLMLLRGWDLIWRRSSVVDSEWNQVCCPSLLCLLILSYIHHTVLNSQNVILFVLHALKSGLVLFAQQYCG